MTEQKNTPAIIAAKTAVALTEQRSSLVARGLVALHENKKREIFCNSQDERYRQARIEFDRREDSTCDLAEDDPDTALLVAFKIFQQLASENYGKAYYPLSIIYHYYEHDECDEHSQKLLCKKSEYFTQLAFDWCFANKSNQDAELWCDFGDMYFYGYGTKQDKEQALYWYSRAAEQGYAPAQYCLGSLYYRSNDKREYWYSKAAEQNYGPALWGLGELCRSDGKLHRSQYWYQKAAEQCGKSFQLKYGIRKLTEKDYEQAVYWLRKAAEQNLIIAKIILGRIHRDGYGNAEQAMYWFRQAAEQGSSSGNYYIGEMFHKGHGIEKNDKEAASWYQLAAERGNEDAQEALKKLGIDWKK